MELNNCLKVSYQGLLRYIICDVGCRYEDILKLVIETFKIPAEYRNALLVVNENGYIFEKQLFEYFILLFPHPEITFYIRLNRNKISNINGNTAPTDVQDSRLPFGNSKSSNNNSNINKRSRTRLDDDDAYQAVPVSRQNCFYGEMPSTTAAAALSRHNATDMSQSAGTNLRRQNVDVEFSKPLAKRIRLMDSVQKKARSLSKRSLRI